MNLDLWELVLGFLDPKESNCFIRANLSLIEEKFLSLTRDCSTDQVNALRNILLSTKDQLVLGGPGTGKSYIIHIARKMLEWLGEESRVCAWTALAAKNVGGQTIMSLLPLYKVNRQWNCEKGEPQFRCPKVVPEWKILFVDEISMVDWASFEQMLYLLRDTHVRICAFGDFRQLPPINVASQRKYVFESRFFQFFQVSQLLTRHRQKHTGFVEIIEKIGENKIDQEVRRFLHRRHVAYYRLPSQEAKEKLVHLYFYNSDVGRHNRACFARLKSPETTVPFEVDQVYHRSTRSSKKFTDQVSSQTLLEYSGDHALEIYPALERAIGRQKIKEVYLKEGAWMMFTKNIYGVPVAESAYEYYEALRGKGDDEIEYVDICNGTRCQIVDVLDHGIIVNIEDPEIKEMYYPLRYYHVYFETQYIDQGDFVLETCRYAKVKYYPLMLNYAMTIHRSQGLTLNNVALDLRALQNPNMAYVAVSRCRSPDQLYVIRHSSPKSGFDPILQKFYEWLRSPNPFPVQEFCGADKLFLPVWAQASRRGRPQKRQEPAKPRKSQVSTEDPEEPEELPLFIVQKHGRGNYDLKVGAYMFSSIRNQNEVVSILKEHLEDLTKKRLRELVREQVGKKRKRTTSPTV